MYVGPNTIDASFSMKYFNIFVFQYNDVLDLAQIQRKLSVNLSCGVIELIGSFVRKEDLYLFIDCGQFSDQEESSTKFLMDLLTLGTQSHHIHKIISVSSGASANHNNSYSDTLIKSLDYFKSLQLKGFTETKYIQTINVGF